MVTVIWTKAPIDCIQCTCPWSRERNFHTTGVQHHRRDGDGSRNLCEAAGKENDIKRSKLRLLQQHELCQTAPPFRPPTDNTNSNPRISRKTATEDHCSTEDHRARSWNGTQHRAGRDVKCRHTSAAEDMLFGVPSILICVMLWTWHTFSTVMF